MCSGAPGTDVPAADPALVVDTDASAAVVVVVGVEVAFGSGIAEAVAVDSFQTFLVDWVVVVVVVAS